MTTTLKAAPANLAAQLAAAAKGGVDVIALEGVFGRFGVPGLKPPANVVIDLTAAALTDTVLVEGGARNWTFKGGEWTGGAYAALQVEDAAFITVEGAFFHDWSNTGAAISFQRCTDSAVRNCRFAHSAGDGIDLAACQRISIAHNRFWDITQAQTPAGASLGNHTDCVQMWNLAGQPITSDIAITDNIAVVACQGFGHYGETAGAPAGNLRVEISRNAIATKMAWAGHLLNAKACTMRDNFAETIVGETKGWQPPTWLCTDGPDEKTADSGKAQNLAARNVGGVRPLG